MQGFVHFIVPVGLQVSKGQAYCRQAYLEACAVFQTERLIHKGYNHFCHLKGVILSISMLFVFVLG